MFHMLLCPITSPQDPRPFLSLINSFSKSLLCRCLLFPLLIRAALSVNVVFGQNKQTFVQNLAGCPPLQSVSWHARVQSVSCPTYGTPEDTDRPLGADIFSAMGGRDNREQICQSSWHLSAAQHCVPHGCPIQTPLKKETVRKES